MKKYYSRYNKIVENNFFFSFFSFKYNYCKYILYRQKNIESNGQGRRDINIVLFYCV